MTDTSPERELEIIQQAISKSKDPGVVKVQLDNAVIIISSLPASSEYFQHNFAGWISFLLMEVAPNWVACLTSLEKTLLFDVFFQRAPAVPVLLALAGVITASRDEFACAATARQLELFMNSNRISNLLLEVANRADTQKRIHEWSRCESAIHSLPDRVANRLHSKTPQPLIPIDFFASVLESAFKLLSNSSPDALSTSSGSFLWTTAVPQTYGRIARAGYADLASATLLRHLNKTISLEDTSIRNQFLSLWENFFSSVPENQLEYVIDSVLRSSETQKLENAPEVMKSVWVKSVTRSEVFRYLLLSKLPLNKLYSNAARALLQDLVCLLPSHEGKISRAVELCERVSAVWSDATFVRSSPLEKHTHYTELLMGLLKRIDKAQFDASQLYATLLKGVQHHIGSSQRKIRIMGMRVGKAFSTIVDPAHPLEFDIEEETQKQQQEETREEEKTDSKKETKQQPQLKRKTRVDRPDDPDRLVLLPEEDENNDEEVVEDFASEEGTQQKTADLALEEEEDDLKPYDLTDDQSDLRTRRPVYVRELLVGLRNTENAEPQEAALSVAESIIRSNPPDLADVCVPLTSALIHLSDEFHLTDFHARRSAALIALAVTCTEPVAQYLTTQFYERNYSIQHRLDMLDVLIEAAYELSELKRAEEVEFNSEQKTAKRSPFAIDVKKPSATNTVVQQRIQANTRRWGGGPRAERLTGRNRFEPVAQLFFYPLLSRYDSSKNTLNLLGEDSMILGKLLYALGVFIYSAGFSLKSDKMYSNLIDVALRLRYHPDAYVRKATLVSLHLPLPTFSTAVLQDLFDRRGDLEDVSEWITAQTTEDPDEDCRTLAIQLMLQLRNKLHPDKGLVA